MLHDVLAAVRHGCPVSELGYRALPCGERHLRSRGHLAKLFPAQLLEESHAIADRCGFRLEQLHYRYPREIVPEGMSATTYLRELTEAGIRERWPEMGETEKGSGSLSGAYAHQKVNLTPFLTPFPSLRQQIEKELELIEELHYEPFFLTVYDIVKFAKSQGILCQGRGSAANSAVCYCLGITEVDPARMSMLFERFISRDRDEPPDIDVDFEHERREEVIQYIYRKYGRDRAALAATVITYRPKSAIRDVGKALGLPLTQIDLLANNMAWWDQPESFEQRMAQLGLRIDPLKMKQLVHLVHSIIGFPRHLSQHVGGFVISDTPLASLVPVENAAMAGRTVIQWDKEDLETLGMLKVDCLALGMLTVIHRCLDLLKEKKGSGSLSDARKRQKVNLTPFFPTMDSIPAEDPETYAMIQRADTIGVFQIESRAQMAMLPRLKPACFYDLVIEVAIVRPGPIQGNMVHPYLQRRRGTERVEYPSDDLKAVLERTLGVPIFQEQVMQVAMVAAGFSGSEADVLRRSMAAWARRGGMEHMHQRLVSGMLERGYSEAFAEQIFQQIRGFGEYGFPESHAASFALLVYVSAWLKCHHPAEFCCALLNSQPMGFYQPAQLVQDAQRHGVKVLPADVRYSNWDCTLEETRGAKKGSGSLSGAYAHQKVNLTPFLRPFSPALRLGLRMVKGMREKSALRLEQARGERPFDNVQDLAVRAGLDRHDLAVLAEAAALRGLAGPRHRARWEIAAVEKPVDDLLKPAAKSEPDPFYSIRPPSEVDNTRADYASTGLTLGRHPIALLRSVLKRRRAITARELHRKPHESRVRACGLVTMRQRPMTASGTIFLTLEDETGFVNVVIWPRLFEKQRAEILAASILAVDGVLETDGDVHHLIASRVHDFSFLAENLQSRSRDFC
jgi:error-prone DNA polymerase